MSAERPIGTWAFAGVAIASLGGPPALAALIVPSIAEDAISSAGLLTLASAVVFAVFPRFAARRGLPRLPAWALSGVATALAGYGLYLSIAQPAS